MKVYSYVFFKHFIFLALIFRSVVHFEWSRGPNSFFCVWVFSCPSTICCKDYFFPIEFSWDPCWKSVNCKCKCKHLFLHSGFYSIDLMSVLIPEPHCLDYCSFEVSFEVRKCESSNIFLLFQDCFWIFWISYFCMNFEIISLLISTKKICDFWDVLNL